MKEQQATDVWMVNGKSKNFKKGTISVGMAQEIMQKSTALIDSGQGVQVVFDGKQYDDVWADLALDENNTTVSGN